MKKIVLFSILCLVATAVKAQSINGRIIDEQSKPMTFTNVVLLSRADSAFIAGSVTNEDGTFTITTDCADCLLKVSSVGYATRFVDARQGSVGDIQMQPDAQELGEVVVKSERPQYKMTTGGMTVEIQNSLLKDVGTADDVLSMLPNVEGEDGKFTVFAKGTPEIYINNKKVQNARELKQLKSTDIKSVDVITSPGAKYNAEVGAVIRIKTVRRQGEGISAELYSQVKYNHKWTNYDDATVKYRTGGLEIFGNMSFTHGNYSEENTLITDTRANGNHVHIEHSAPTNFWNTLMSGKIGASYDFNDDNSVGFSYELSGAPRRASGDADCVQTIMRNGQLEGVVNQYMRHTSGYEPTHESNLYYVGKWGKMGIDFNASYVWNKSSVEILSEERSEELPDQDIHSYNVNHNRMLAGKLVLSYPIWKGELSVGSEMIRSNGHGEYFNLEQVVPPSDDEIKERNTAVFAEYQMQLGAWSVGGGLRYESVHSDYYSFGEHQAEPSRKYRDLFPNLAVAWQKEKWGVQLSYNKRISRPSYHSLNSNVQYDNRYEYEGGNPLLRPSVIQNLGLNVTYSWLNFTASYGHNKDQQLSFGSLYKEGTEITIWRGLNFDKFQTYNVSLTASPKFGFYSPTLTLSYFQQNFDTQAYGLDSKLNKPEFKISFRNWFTIDKTTKAMVYLRYSTRYNYGFNYNHHAFNVNGRVQKTFLSGSLTAILFANDIFRTLKNRWKGIYPVTSMEKDAYSYTQCIGLSLSYNLNATRSKYRGTGAGNDEKNRLK
ncbi:MAG: TonB-dependent receptor family protein [Prevotella sp.]|nr:TonB-dependent receptor family protein [Prevotella sp.]